MRYISKYVIAALVVVGISLAAAKVSASGACHLETTDEYTCYVTGEDACYCYYDCYCKVSDSACDAALTRDGFIIL